MSDKRVIAISAIVLVAVIMGMSALAPAISSNLATENTILPSAWAHCHQGDSEASGDGDVDCEVPGPGETEEEKEQ